METWRSWQTRFKAAQKKARKTDADIAADISEILSEDYTRAAITHWLTGTRNVTLNKFMALCESIGADPSEILFGKRSALGLSAQDSSVAVYLAKPPSQPEQLDAAASELAARDRARRFKAKRSRIRTRRSTFP